MSHWIKIRRPGSATSPALGFWKKIRKPIKLSTIKPQLFIKACEMASIPPTLRQFKKWLAKRGLAFSFREAAKHQLLSQAQESTMN